MSALPLVLASALALGALHAFDADHLASVTAFIAHRPSARAALEFALRWGFGHAATLLGVGLAFTLFRLSMTPLSQTAAELAVGAVLIGVGLWALLGARRGRDAGGRRSLLWIGALHGMAGSAGVLAIIPVALMGSAWAVLGYILMFSAGVTLAMAACALAIGGLFGRAAGGAGARWHPWLAGAAGSVTLLLGLAWISLTIATRAA